MAMPLHGLWEVADGTGISVKGESPDRYDGVADAIPQCGLALSRAQAG